MIRLAAFVALAVTLLLATAASAHKPSDSYLSLTVEEGQIEGRWDVALRDLDYAIGLDRDGDGAITWGEVKAKHGDIAAYALARLEIANGGTICPTSPVAHLVDRHSDGAYAVLRFAADCASPIDALEVSYSFLFDLDPSHRGLVQIRSGDTTHAGVLGPDRRRWHVVLGTPDLVAQFSAYLREGVWHIWLGLDHILFLLCVLLPAIGRRSGGAGEPPEHLGSMLTSAAKIVTAFTLAHSITLSLAVLGVVELPSRLVESVIAGSVVVAALNTVYPIVTRRLWLVALGFGLIHGFGFASALVDLGLPQNALLLALLSFNLGVEVGQLVLVAALLAICWAVRRVEIVWPRWAMPLPSYAIAAIAAVWFVERAFGVALAR